MTTTQRHEPHRRVDAASVLLTAIGLVCGGFSYWLANVHHVNALILIPSIVAITNGVTHLTKRQAPRR